MNNLSGRLLGTVFSLIGCGALFWPKLAPAAPRILFVARGESANNTYELYTRSGGANLLHTLQFTTNCASGSWTAVPGGVDLTSTGATLTVTDGVASAGLRFYRVVARPQ
jgi:hypothetical protein